VVLKAGLITGGSGLVAAIVGIFVGFGPCNSTYAGTILFIGGLLAVLVGCVILVCGVVFRVLDRFSRA
jgi:hypothetical protein